MAFSLFNFGKSDSNDSKQKVVYTSRTLAVL